MVHSGTNKWQIPTINHNRVLKVSDFADIKIIMDLYLIIKTLHIISATILFGTGIGIAFFMLRSHFTDNIHEKFYAARNTVMADYFFTLPAVIVQPMTGFWLVWQGAYSWMDWWLAVTYAIYIIAVLCWLPVVWIQIQLKNMVATAVKTGEPLPERYYRLFKIWFLLGWPAFVGLIIVFYLMVAKPV
tara:strand:- start:1044 stop:1604 length:561 start_codon:yes stop_codon:yes gene_type:complete